MRTLEQTVQSPPQWLETENRRPRVLVEHPDPAAQDVLARDLRRRGYEALTCGGPRAAGDARARCPLLLGERCPAVDGADVVVSGLPLSGSVERRIVQRLPGEGRQVIVEASRQQAESLDVDVMALPRLTRRGVARAVAQALSD